MSDGFVTIPALAAELVERDVVEAATLFYALSAALDCEEHSDAIRGIMRQMAEVLSRLGCAMGLWERLP